MYVSVADPDMTCIFFFKCSTIASSIGRQTLFRLQSGRRADETMPGTEGVGVGRAMDVVAADGVDPAAFTHCNWVVLPADILIGVDRSSMVPPPLQCGCCTGSTTCIANPGLPLLGVAGAFGMGDGTSRRSSLSW